MAKLDDIDTAAAVSKFLQRTTVVDREDRTSDSSDEVQAVLESVALSFLLYPQAALSFVLQAKNILQGLVTTDLAILDYIIAGIADINNPDEVVTDTSHLVDAQTALVEVDRVGRVASDVQAYARYNTAIDKFLNNNLAKSLKRRRKGEFERTGGEAKQDIFSILSSFQPVHDLVIDKLTKLLASVADFESINLTKIVATTTLTRVRNSLAKVIQAAQTQQISNTAMAIELLAGSAALSSISNSRKIYDPTVDSGEFPSNTDILAYSEVTNAKAASTSTVVDLTGVTTPWLFGLTVDGVTPYSVEFPYSGASGRCYVLAESVSPTFDISGSNNTLYVRFDGIAPDTIGPVLLSYRVRAVTLPTGTAVTLGAVLSALNDGVTGLIDGTAVQIGNTNRIMIYGSGSVTKIVILSTVIGTYDGSGNYIPPDGSAHSVLGFSSEQTSSDPVSFTASAAADLLNCYLIDATASVNNDGYLEVDSDQASLVSSLIFTGIASNFGFSTTSTYTPSPSYLELKDSGIVQDPASLGILIGSRVSVGNFSANVTSIIGTQLGFGMNVPVTSGGAVNIIAPVVYIVQQLLLALKTYDGLFDDDYVNVQKVLSPILSQATLAQIDDATRVIQAVRTNVNNLLTLLNNTTLSKDQIEFDSVARQISSSLEERGLDRALETLQGGQFSSFFGLTSVQASKSSRFLTASADVGRTDLTSPTAEKDIQDLSPNGTTPSDDILSGSNLTENEEPQ